MTFEKGFEIFGKVQGVFFRKSTLEKAQELGITGYVMNTSTGTVKGVMQSSSKEKLEEM